jgi:hypothetical protein
MCFGVRANSLETQKFGFKNLNALIVTRNIQDKPEGIFIRDLKNVIGT